MPQTPINLSQNLFVPNIKMNTHIFLREFFDRIREKWISNFYISRVVCYAATIVMSC